MSSNVLDKNKIIGTSSGKLYNQLSIFLNDHYFAVQKSLRDIDFLQSKIFSSSRLSTGKYSNYFKEFSFHNDVKLYEIIAWIVLPHALRKVKSPNGTYNITPFWQIPGRQSVIKQLTGEESWDGFMLCYNQSYSNRVVLIPTEIKSTMINPGNTGKIGSIEEQVEYRLGQHKNEFISGAINGIFSMPYQQDLAEASTLKLDVFRLIYLLKKYMPEKGVRFFLQATFPDDNRIEFICLLCPDGAIEINENNYHKYLTRLNFRKATVNEK